jgi:hypothetical protein
MLGRRKLNLILCELQHPLEVTNFLICFIDFGLSSVGL